MIRTTLLRKAALGLGIAALPFGIAVAGAGTAAANPELCVSGPYGYAYACVEGPGWVDVDWRGPRGKGHWKHGHHRD